MQKVKKIINKFYISLLKMKKTKKNINKILNENKNK